MSRTMAREVAMKLAYSRLLGGEDTPNAVLEKSGIEEPFDAEDTAFAEAVAAGVEAHVEELDALIASHAIDWSIDRIARVDLCILRVALYEMLYRSDVPSGAAINEAVELAKRFGGEKSYAFINGILGVVARELEKPGTTAE